MRYPYLTLSACREIARQLLAGDDPAVDSRAEWVGQGVDADLSRITRAAEQLSEATRNCRPGGDRDLIEGRMSKVVYEALECVPAEVLDDPGFWRYLSLQYFWDFIAWREEKAFANGNHMKYVDGEKSAECVLTRMYLRMAAVGGPEHAGIAGGIPKSTDFWRSHVLRVRTGTAPPLARALAVMQRDNRLATQDIRELAKALSRTWTNVLLNIYTDEEARSLIKELRDETVGRTTPAG